MSGVECPQIVQVGHAVFIDIRTAVSVNGRLAKGGRTIINNAVTGIRGIEAITINVIRPQFLFILDEEHIADVNVVGLITLIKVIIDIDGEAASVIASCDFIGGCVEF